MKNDNAHSKICRIENATLVSKLTANATACCSKCGAKAHDPASLCSPVQCSG